MKVRQIKRKSINSKCFILYEQTFFQFLQMLNMLHRNVCMYEDHETYFGILVQCILFNGISWLKKTRWLNGKKRKLYMKIRKS